MLQQYYKFGHLNRLSEEELESVRNRHLYIYRELLLLLHHSSYCNDSDEIPYAVGCKRFRCSAIAVHELLWIDRYHEGIIVVRVQLVYVCIAVLDFPTLYVQVLELMECAVHVDDVQQIIIDNLQFMMPMSPRGFFGSKSGFEKFEHQDEIIHHLRKFATEKNVIKHFYRIDTQVDRI